MKQIKPKTTDKGEGIEKLYFIIEALNGVVDWQGYQVEELVDKINEIIERLNGGKGK